MFKMAQKEVMEQGSRKLDVTKLHPLSPEIISRQPTINIGLIGHVAHGKTTIVRAISGIQGHEILMTRMLSGATVMGGAFLLIAANESCPQPQTQEHLSAVDILKLRNLIVLQNKVDIVQEDQARNQYKAIRGFLKGVLKVNQIVELRPGIIGKNAHGKTICKPIYSRIMSLFAEQNKLQFAVPGGLIGVGTSMDPALSRSDMLVGQVLGDVGTLPEVYIKLKIRKIELLRQLVGVEKNDSGQKVSSLVKGEVLMLNILSMATGAKIITVRKDCATLELTAPVCTGIAEKVVLSRRVGGH